ncbi:MAG: hypothetical protein NW241_10840 [Bacteroidia bacterium]|nr:hypothetical protein [Bacteroidia bacterium]
MATKQKQPRFQVNIVGKLTKAGALTGGGLAAHALNNVLLPKIIKKNLTPVIANGITLGLAAFGPELLAMWRPEMGSSTLVNGMADGATTVAGMSLMGELAPDLTARVAPRVAVSKKYKAGDVNPASGQPFKAGERDPDGALIQGVGYLTEYVVSGPGDYDPAAAGDLTAPGSILGLAEDTGLSHTI